MRFFTVTSLELEAGDAQVQAKAQVTESSLYFDTSEDVSAILSRVGLLLYNISNTTDLRSLKLNLSRNLQQAVEGPGSCNDLVYSEPSIPSSITSTQRGLSYWPPIGSIWAFLGSWSSIGKYILWVYLKDVSYTIRVQHNR